MIADNQQDTATSPVRNGWRTFGIVMITVIVTLGVVYGIVTVYLFPGAFTPVVLNKKEQQELDKKLRRLGSSNSGSITPKPLEPEAYSEAGASREISLSEKELNALLANNTELASKMAIDLSENLASVKALVNVDPDFPVLGGKTIKITAGLELRLSNGKPSAILKGVSVMGVPLPNTWLGNLKNADLIKEFGQAGGFWQVIHEGVDNIEVSDGKLRIKLKE
jgi:hypothetical protein